MVKVPWRLALQIKESGRSKERKTKTVEEIRDTSLNGRVPHVGGKISKSPFTGGPPFIFRPGDFAGTSLLMQITWNRTDPHTIRTTNPASSPHPLSISSATIICLLVSLLTTPAVLHCKLKSHLLEDSYRNISNPSTRSHPQQNLPQQLLCFFSLVSKLTTSADHLGKPFDVTHS